MKRRKLARDFGTFLLEEEFKLASTDLDIKLFRSNETGLSVIIGKCNGPIVNGHFVLSTEAVLSNGGPNHDGCPHTLEHLVFLGSEQYPYRGVLDEVANRSFAQGTNAWTDTDHTCYTMTHAGEEGFLRLLPLYLDHILYPTLNDSGFDTEVHHITAEGTNAGVVYCEMQGRENDQNSVTSRAALESVFGGTGYASETGGLLSELRLLTNARVREYHKAYYRPDNLCLIVTGSIDEDALFRTLSLFETSRILPKGQLPQMMRPWSSALPDFTASVTQEVKFPTEDEETGSVLFLWRGPLWLDFEGRTATAVFLKYLTSSAISPLQQSFVECPEPLASEIDHHVHPFRVTGFEITFENVPRERLLDVRPRLFELLQSIAQRGVDMERIHAVIRRMRKKAVLKMEASPSDFMTDFAIDFFVYRHLATPGPSLASYMAVVERLDALLLQPPAFWQALLSRGLLEAPVATIVGVPSATFAEQQRSEEAARIHCQAQALLARDSLALEKAGARLAASLAASSTRAPSELIASFCLPLLDRIPLHQLFTWRNRPPTFELCDLSEPIALFTNLNAAHPDAQALQDLFEAPLIPAIPSATSIIPEIKTSRYALRSRTMVENARVRQGTAQGHVAAVLPEDWPCWVQVDHVCSRFATVRLVLDSGSVPASLRPLLPLLLELLFKSPLEADAVHTGSTHEAVIAALQNDTVDYGATVGLGGDAVCPGAFGQFVSVFVKVETTQLPNALAWLADAVLSSRLDALRLKSAAQRLLLSLPELRNEPAALLQAVLNESNFASDANAHALQFLRQQQVLSSILSSFGESVEGLDESGSEDLEGSANIAGESIESGETDGEEDGETDSDPAGLARAGTEAVAALESLRAHLLAAPTPIQLHVVADCLMLRSAGVDVRLAIHQHLVSRLKTHGFCARPLPKQQMAASRFASKRRQEGQDLDLPASNRKLGFSREHLRELGSDAAAGCAHGQAKGKLLSVAASDSAHLLACARLPISSFAHPDVWALRVFVLQ